MYTKHINVLSLFDGMSCGRIALERSGINVNNYYASEIDKYTIAVTQYNYPDTIQVGDITKLKGENLPKIDLIMGGSPCQGFSFAGKQLNFDDSRSALFFEFVRLIKECKPKYFLLENVRMKQEFQDIISKQLGVKPIMINSSLLSAQNRVRLYWTNIPNIVQPEDKGIVLKDILEDYSESMGAWRGRYLVDGKRQDYKMKTAGLTEQRLELRSDNKSNTLTGVQKDNVVINKCIQIGETKGKGYDSIKRVYSDEGKSPSLTTMQGGNTQPKVVVDTKPDLTWRKLTPLECERLQTVPDNYTKVPWLNRFMSNSQRYKMLGNGWTVDVISHILNNYERTFNIN